MPTMNIHRVGWNKYSKHGIGGGTSNEAIINRGFTTEVVTTLSVPNFPCIMLILRTCIPTSITSDRNHDHKQQSLDGVAYCQGWVEIELDLHEWADIVI